MDVSILDISRKILSLACTSECHSTDAALLAVEWTCICRVACSCGRKELSIEHKECPELNKDISIGPNKDKVTHQTLRLSNASSKPVQRLRRQDGTARPTQATTGHVLGQQHVPH